MSLKSKLHYEYLLETFGLLRTKEILQINPTVTPNRINKDGTRITIFEYSPTYYKEYKDVSLNDCAALANNENIKWINIDGINKEIVEKVCSIFKVHYLVGEDIESIGQRPKMDELDNHLFCLLQMIYFNQKETAVESEQISIILGSSYVISFQEDESRDVFDNLRDKLKVTNTKLRNKPADYLCYTMLDMIVDHYYIVMEKLAENIEVLEEEIIKAPNTKSLGNINHLRKELIILKRNIAPVRELVNGFLKSDSPLIETNTLKYFKDVYDHVVQANDLVENYRDIMINMQDLYINQVNLKMNEVMKVMTIVTCLLAPATVIGGIFGMNFEEIPYLHNQFGFYLAVGAMLIIPILMIVIFKKRDWF